MAGVGLGAGYTRSCRAQLWLHHGNLQHLPGVAWSDLAALCEGLEREARREEEDRVGRCCPDSGVKWWASQPGRGRRDAEKWMGFSNI